MTVRDFSEMRLRPTADPNSHQGSFNCPEPTHHRGGRTFRTEWLP